MINLIVIRNPFDPTKKENTLTAYKTGQPISFYFNEQGDWQYSINGIPSKPTEIVPDECYIVVMPVVEKKIFGLILTIGLSVVTGGIAGGTILGAIGNAFWRSVIAMTIGVIGGTVISKLTAVKPDKSNGTEQANTYGWGGARTLTGQGFPLATTYGRMKSAGILLSRHVISDGEKQYLNLLYCAGEGELTTIDNIRINENPIENYKDVSVDIRLGTNDQTVIPNFNDNYADQPLNYELTENWSSHQVQGNTCEAIELTVSFPNGLYYSNDSGGMSKTYVKLEAEYRKVGEELWQRLPLASEVDDSGSKKKLKSYLFRKGNMWRRNSTQEAIEDDGYAGEIKKATNKSWHRVYRFDNLPPAQYEVRMRCAKKEGNSVRYVNKVYWSQLTQIIYDDFIHPGKALIGIKALATDQLSGSDPQITWEQERKDIYAWNPYIGAYEAKPANNPAWVCYDVIHQCRKIGAQYVVRGEKANRILYDRFKAWADECDERGCSFNYIYDAAGQLWEQLKFPEIVGRGKVIMQGTRFTCVYDYAAMPTQLFTVGNIRKDSFREDFQGLQGRANAVEISFLNKAKNYERDVLPVYSDSYDSVESLSNPAQVELMGCVDLEQAYKHGKHYLRANRYEIRTITFEAYQDAIACTIGDVILVQHDMTDWGTGGRIKRVSDTGITLDREVDVSEGAYRLLVRDSHTDEIQTYNITGGDKDVIIVDSTGGISEDALYTIGKIGKEAKPFRVLAISKGMNDTTRKITCIEYYPELYVSDDGDVPVINYSSGQGGLLDATNLRLNKSVKTLQDGTILCDIVGSWVMPRGRSAKAIYVYYKRIDAPEFTLYKVLDGSETAVVIQNVATTENYTVKILCTNDIGVAGSGVSEDIYIAGKDLPPADVTGFYATQDTKNSSILHLKWTPLNAPDIAGYKLYDDSGTELVELIQGSTYTYFIPESGTYKFGIRGIDTSGNASQNMTLATITAEVSAESVAVPAAPTNGIVSLSKDSIMASWDAVTNTYVAYYEIHSAPNTDTDSLLAKTTDIRSSINLSNRSGTVYVFAYNPVKGYGAALSIDYSFAQPPVPVVQIVETISGFSVRVGELPGACKELHIIILNSSEEMQLIKTQNTQYVHICPADIYTVITMYADMFGCGDYSAPQTITVKPTIDPKYLQEMEVTEAQLGQALKDKLAGLEETDIGLSRSITGITEELNKAPAESGYQSIHALVNTMAEMSSTIAANKTEQDGVNATTATQIQQNAESINSVAMRTTESETQITQIKQTADGLASTVQSNKTEQDTKNTQFSSQITQNANSVTSIVANLSKAPGSTGYSAISQLYDSMQLKVEQSGVIAAINLSPSTIKIAGKYIAVTGDTQFSDNVIVNRMIAANAVTAGKIASGSITADKIASKAVTADKLSVNSLSAVSANLGTVTAGTIAANIITQAGFNVKSCVIISGTVSGKNGIIPLPAGYTWNQCVCIAYHPQQDLVDGSFRAFESGTGQDKRLKVFCQYLEIRETMDISYYVDVAYRVIGIK